MRIIYSQRLGTVEPPFGNLRFHKGLDRFTLRGREIVGGQWKLYALVHNDYRLEGTDFDLYYTNHPTAGVGNGLGGRATVEQIAGYRVILYSSGDLYEQTITPVDYNGDAGDDIGLLESWLQNGTGGNRGLFLTGDKLLYDLNDSGPVAQAFADGWISATWMGLDLAADVGGQLAPTVQAVPLQWRTVTIHTALAGPNQIEVAVKDCGKGLDEEEAERVFEPFYTSKADGMGLGLSISRSIVEAHGGRLVAAPHAGEGTTMRFTLPIDSESTDSEGGKR